MEVVFADYERLAPAANPVVGGCWSRPTGTGDNTLPGGSRDALRPSAGFPQHEGLVSLQL